MSKETYKPKTDDEWKIALLLKIYGYEEVEFKDMGDKGDRIINIGFRERMESKDFDKIQINGNLKLEEVDFEDDDCGTGYFYIIHSK